MRILAIEAMGCMVSAVKNNAAIISQDFPLVMNWLLDLETKVINLDPTDGQLKALLVVPNTLTHKIFNL